MFSRSLTSVSTGACSEAVDRLREALERADAVVVGAGAGLSASAGLTYDGARFEEHFGDFIAKYHIPDMYAGGFYPFESLEEYWAWWSRQILLNRYEKAPRPVYEALLALVGERDCFVLTTNVDHQFQMAGFDKKRLFYTQGDYGLWQCSQPCHQETYDNEETVRRMAAEQRDMRVPPELVPRCPRCGRPMTMNLRCDSTFVEDAGWHAAAGRYAEFLRRHRGGADAVPGAGCGRQHPGDHQVPLLADDDAKPKCGLCLHQPGGALCPPGPAAARHRDFRRHRGRAGPSLRSGSIEPRTETGAHGESMGACWHITGERIYGAVLPCAGICPVQKKV